jgi:NAD(P)-dependent dehydrogenase (short-subunit alcohol dehydrogenase family)
MDFNNLMLAQGYTDGRAYGQSKLAQILMTVDMAEELDGSGVTIAALHPATYMGTNMVLERGIDPITSVEQGADAVMNVIGSPTVENGSFFNGLNRANPNAQARDSEARARLRAMSEELSGL